MQIATETCENQCIGHSILHNNSQEKSLCVYQRSERDTTTKLEANGQLVPIFCTCRRSQNNQKLRFYLVNASLVSKNGPLLMFLCLFHRCRQYNFSSPVIQQRERGRENKSLA